MHLQGEVRVAVKHAAAKTKEGLEEQVDNGRIKKYFFWGGWGSAEEVFIWTDSVRVVAV